MKDFIAQNKTHPEQGGEALGGDMYKVELIVELLCTIQGVPFLQ